MSRYHSRHASHHRRIWPVGLVIGLIMVVLLIVGVHHSINTTASQMMTTNSRSLPKKLRNGQPFTVLVMGTDVGALGRGTAYAGNTDTMELLTVNPKQKKILMVAIPRDTLVRVNTKEGLDFVKINAAYAIGGAKQAKKQVAELLHVPVDYYVLTNMGTLKKVVNAVGGVTINNPFAFTYEGHHFKKGKQHLNGNEALKYSRMRYDDPNNDYGRQERGQQILQSAIVSFKQHGSLNAASQIMTAVQDGVRTDLPINQVGRLYLSYHLALTNTTHTHLQGKDAIIDDTSFQIAPPKEMLRLSNLVRQTLEISSQHSIDNYETRMYYQQYSWNGYNRLNFMLPNGASYNQPGSGIWHSKEEDSSGI